MTRETIPGDKADQFAMSRQWAMPSPATFSIQPISQFVRRHTDGASIIVDPFARNAGLASHSNDLDPTTDAQEHMDAAEYLDSLISSGVVADAVLFDPPYSPRQIAEVHKRVGLQVGMADTQNARLYRAVKDRLHTLLRQGGTALSFGWNSSGFGQSRGYAQIEILLVSHGGAHNDTICVAERKAR